MKCSAIERQFDQYRDKPAGWSSVAQVRLETMFAALWQRSTGTKNSSI